MSDFEAYLRSLKEGCTPSRTVDAMFYSLLGGGKRVRPRLLFAALRGYGLPEQTGYPCAAAIEMIHTYSLIHDDLPAMDDDTLRRGRKTCHIAFDEATAILAGDGLLTDAFSIVLRCACTDAQKVKLVSPAQRIQRQRRHDPGPDARYRSRSKCKSWTGRSWRRSICTRPVVCSRCRCCARPCWQDMRRICRS